MKFALYLIVIITLVSASGCFFRGDRGGGGGERHSDFNDHGGGHDDLGESHDDHH